MRRLGAGRSLVWIDHHKTALAGLCEAMAGIPGERVDRGRRLRPDLADLLSRAFTAAGRRAHRRPRHLADGPSGDAALLRGPVPGGYPAGERRTMETVVGRRPSSSRSARRAGPHLVRGKAQEDPGVVARCGFPAAFEGHQTLAVNHPGNGDMGEYIRQTGYELAYCYVEVVRQDQLQTVVTLYSDQIDVSEIARKIRRGRTSRRRRFPIPPVGSPIPAERADVLLGAGRLIARVARRSWPVRRPGADG